MAYTPSSLDKEDTSAINSIRDNLLTSLDDSIAHLEILKESLELYRNTVGKSIDSSLEYADIISKYTEPDRNSSTYGLPGVMASTVASYDLSSIKADNAKLKDCKEDKERSARQRDTYFKSAVRNFAILKTDLNGVGDANQRLFAFLEMLNNKIS